MTTATADINSATTWIMRPQSRVPGWLRALFKNPISVTGMILI